MIDVSAESRQKLTFDQIIHLGSESHSTKCILIFASDFTPSSLSVALVVLGPGARQINTRMVGSSIGNNHRSAGNRYRPLIPYRKGVGGRASGSPLRNPLLRRTWSSQDAPSSHGHPRTTGTRPSMGESWGNSRHKRQGSKRWTKCGFGLQCLYPL